MRYLSARAWLMAEIDRKSVLASISGATGALSARGPLKNSRWEEDREAVRRNPA